MKPTTEHIITALRDGIALRTDLCERLGCENAALTKVIRNMLDRDLITRDLQDGALAYYLTAKGHAWQPGMQSASVRAKAKAKGGDSEGGEADVRVIKQAAVKSDEVSTVNEAKSDMPLVAAQQAQSGYASNMLGAKSSLDKIFGIGQLEEELKNATALADKLQSLLTSKEHECEALRVQLGEPRRAPALALHDHIYAVAAALYDGQNITIGKESLVVQSQCRNFRCKPQDVKSVLDASAMLARLEAA